MTWFIVFEISVWVISTHVGSGPWFDPIQIIGVDQATNKIYGYYQDLDGMWTRKPTMWGISKMCTANKQIPPVVWSKMIRQAQYSLNILNTYRVHSKLPA